MQRAILSVLAVLFALPMAFQTQTQTAAPHLPRGTTINVSNSEIQATVKKTSSAAVSYQQLRVVDVGEYNVGVGIVHRAKTTGRNPNGIEHSQITEVYHVIEGSATLVTGGMLENPKDTPADSQTVTLLNGPSTNGGEIQNGLSRKIVAGD